ncbi:MAG TPA: N-acetylneuraminate synthase family protein [Acidobacteriota bacterium]|nr:N-acetylneuraminate synthase family protein [Acidobacteriota bacterium]
MKETDILIGQKVIGSGSQVFVIAEIGINHNGSPAQAEKLIDAAAASGADAVKFTSYRTDYLLIPSRDRYVKQADGEESAYQILRRCELSRESQEKLKKHADKRNTLFLSTPFDEESADFLDSLEVPVFKVASSDITHVPLLRHIASKGKPVFLSTGMSFLSEVADAVWILRSAGAKEILLMHCVSSYPAAPQHMNLRALQTMQSYFELPVGLSDHSEGILLAPVAVALGAVVIEKHFTLDKNAAGPHHRASMDPAELKEMVHSLRHVESSLGDGRKRPSDVEEESRLFSRRSVVAAVDIRAQEKIAPWMLSFKRPGSGLEPRHSEKIIGMIARRNIGKDTILQWEDLAPSVSADSISQNPKLDRDADSLKESLSGRRHA